MQVNNLLIPVIALLTINSCAKSDLTPDEYKKWLASDDGIRKVKDMGGYKYTLTFLPNDWMNYTRLAGKVDSASTDDLIYFRLDIDALDGGGNLLRQNIAQKEEYFERLYYVSYLMKDDIKLNFAGKYYACILYHYERAYDLTSKLSFMIGFEKPAPIEEDLTVEVMPKYFSDIEVKFKFKKDAIESVPKLKLNEQHN